MADYDRGLRIHELLDKDMTHKEITDVLRAEGYKNVTDNTVKNFVQNQWKNLQAEKRKELNAKVFQSPEVVYKHIEEILSDYDRYKDVLDEKMEQVRDMEDTRELVSIINSSLNILNSKTRVMEKALQKLGEIKTGLIRADNINIEQKNIVFTTQEVLKNIISDSNTEYVDGKIIINNPKPEIIDVYYNVKRD